MNVGDGDLTGTLTVFPTEMGRITMRSIKAHVEGKELPQFTVTPTMILDEYNYDELPYN